MAVKKEDVLAKAQELGLTLSDAEVDRFVAENKLPEKKVPSGTRVEQLLAQHSPRELAEMYLETASEAKDRRLEARTLKEQLEAVGKEIEGYKTQLKDVPGISEQLKKANDLVASFKDGEKKRRAAIIEKLDEKKRGAVGICSTWSGSAHKSLMQQRSFWAPGSQVRV